MAGSRYPGPGLSGYLAGERGREGVLAPERPPVPARGGDLSEDTGRGRTVGGTQGYAGSVHEARPHRNDRGSPGRPENPGAGKASGLLGRVVPGREALLPVLPSVQPIPSWFASPPGTVAALALRGALGTFEYRCHRPPPA